MSQPIPQPQVLDPDRVLSDDREEMTAEEHRSRARDLDAALHDTCAYARQLWTDVARARQYLYDSLPPDPRHPANERVGTSPTGPDDEPGWQQWQDAYSELTSVLAGPHGDSGLGRSEARAAAELRRSAPNAQLRAAHPDLIHTLAPVTEPDAQTPPTQPQPTAAAPPTAAPLQKAEPTSAQGTVEKIARPAAIGVLLLLALRGLRAPRRERPAR